MYGEVLLIVGILGLWFLGWSIGQLMAIDAFRKEVKENQAKTNELLEKIREELLRLTGKKM